MNRWLAAAIAVVVAVPLAVVAGDPKLDAFRSAALAERKKLGLDKDQKALFAKYPTPEVTFAAAGGGGAVGEVVLCPDETKVITLAGKLPTGAFVSVRSDAVEIVKQAQTPKGWEATVHAAKTATPSRVDVEVLSPVSLATAYVNGLVIGCDHTWTFDVAGGDTLVVKTRYQKEREVRAPGEWKRAAKVLGSVPYRVSAEMGNLSLDQDQTQDDAMAQMNALTAMMQSPEMKAIDARMNASMKKLDGCGKLPPEKMAACFAGPQKELEAINKDRDALVARAEVKASPAFGCRRINVTVKDGVAKGEAEGCAGKRSQERVPVTGRYTSP
jgi:hypothetical protein